MRRRQRKNKPRRKYRKRTQRGGLLNRYDFAYAGRDTVNQVTKIAPGMIKNTGSKINNVAQQRLNQIISLGGKEMERVFPEILRVAIEDVYQTPFRLLGNFRKQQLNKLKNKMLRSNICKLLTIVYTKNQTVQ